LALSYIFSETLWGKKGEGINWGKKSGGEIVLVGGSEWIQ